MNPILKTTPDNAVIYELTEEDRKLIKSTKLRVKPAEDPEDIIFHSMCIMQLVSLVSSEANKAITPEWESRYRKEITKARRRGEDWIDVVDEEVPSLPTDEPICVSAAIADYLIRLNDDEQITPRQRAELKKVIEDVLNTCPVQRREYARGFGGQGHTVVEEERLLTDEYVTAESQRRDILNAVPHDAPMREKLAAVRRAAALYKTDQLTAPGTE